VFLLFFFFFNSLLQTNKVYAVCFLVNVFEEQTCTHLFLNEEDLNKWAKGSWPQHGGGGGGRRKIREFFYSLKSKLMHQFSTSLIFHVLLICLMEILETWKK
jgi:hypothetical protein